MLGIAYLDDDIRKAFFEMDRKRPLHFSAVGEDGDRINRQFFRFESDRALWISVLRLVMRFVRAVGFRRANLCWLPKMHLCDSRNARVDSAGLAANDQALVLVS